MNHTTPPKRLKGGQVPPRNKLYLELIRKGLVACVPTGTDYQG